MTEKKVCGKCKKEKFLDEFHNNSTKKDGLRSICKECSKEYHKQHYLNNIKKYKAKAEQTQESYSGRLRQPSKLEREITPWVRIPLPAQNIPSCCGCTRSVN